MKIDEYSLVADILNTWPGLQEKLEQIDVRAKLAVTPLGRRLMRKMTVNDVSRETGIPVDELIRRLNELIQDL